MNLQEPTSGKKSLWIVVVLIKPDTPHKPLVLEFNSRRRKVRAVCYVATEGSYSRTNLNPVPDLNLLLTKGRVLPESRNLNTHTHIGCDAGRRVKSGKIYCTPESHQTTLFRRDFEAKTHLKNYSPINLRRKRSVCPSSTVAPRSRRIDCGVFSTKGIKIRSIVRSFISLFWQPVRNCRINPFIVRSLLRQGIGRF